MGEEKRESAKVYNIVDSVKGGSGKTTFALMLSLLLDNRLTEKRENEESSVCLVDMDIQGSALLYLLFGKSFLDGKKDGESIAYLNDRVIAVGEESDKKWDYINAFYFKDNRSSGPRTDVILCDPRTESKKKFRSMSNQNYSPEVLYSTYRMGLGNMLSGLNGMEAYLHKHVIFDMPPNADGYSDAVYDVLIKKEYSVMGKNDKCNLFLMSTMDKGQQLATLDYFFEQASSENFQKFDKIFFVFNDWCGFKEISTKTLKPDDKTGSQGIGILDKDAPGFFTEAVLFFKDQISKNSMICRNTIRDKIVFLGLKFDIPYYRMCTQGDGIWNNDMPEGLLDPIKYLADMNTDLNNMKNTDNTECLLKILDLNNGK